MKEILNNEDFVADLLQLLIEHEYVDKHSLRNHDIRKYYNHLRYTVKLSCKECRDKTAEKFGLVPKSIEGIVYSKKRRYGE